jgi:hypothetical protein
LRESESEGGFVRARAGSACTHMHTHTYTNTLSQDAVA